MNPAASSGWQCPVCLHVMSPSVAVCMYCPAKAGPSAVPAAAGPFPPPFAALDAGYRYLVTREWVRVDSAFECRMIRAMFACSPDGEPVGVELEIRAVPSEGCESA